jgi:hypothetical protein
MITERLNLDFAAKAIGQERLDGGSCADQRVGALRRQVGIGQ